MLRSRSVAALALGLAVLASGCSDARLTIATRTLGPSSPAAIPEVAADDAHGWTGWYPLAEGNWWRSLSGFSMRLTPTGGVPGPWDGEGWETRREIACAATIDGRDYLVEALSNVDVGYRWIPFRQDATGLYEAAVEITTPWCDGATDRMRAPVTRGGQSPREALLRRLASMPPAGAEPVTFAATVRDLDARARTLERALGRSGVPAGTELTRLADPLRPGQTGVVNEVLDLRATVTGRERRDVPGLGMFHVLAVKLHGPMFGPDDRAVTWWSKDGMIGYRFEFFGDWVDNSGRVIGRIEAVSQDQLMSWYVDGVLHEPSFP